MKGRALVIGAIFEVAAVIFFVVADDPYMSFLLAITGVSMSVMAFLLVHAMGSTGHAAHVSLPEWTVAFSRGAKKPSSAPSGVHLPPPSLMPFAICAGAAILFFGLAINMSFLALGVIVLAVALVGWLADARREWRATVDARGGDLHLPESPRPSRLLVDVLLIGFFSLIIGQSAILAPAAKADSSVSQVDPTRPTMTASGVQFTSSSFVVKAGAAAILTFTNSDAGVPHNIAIREAGKTGTPIFAGEQISGPATATYTLPALHADLHYVFFCQVHANMKGTVNVVP